MNIKSILWFLALLLPGVCVFAQSAVNVNTLTGAVNFGIPIFTVTTG